MAQHCFGPSGSSTFQSTRKATHHCVSVKLLEEGHSFKNDSSGEKLLFETLDDSHEQQSEDSGINTVSHRGSTVNEVDEGIVSTQSNTKIDEIGKKAQDLIERINKSRAMDQKLMNSFEEKLMKKVSEMCQLVKEQMFEYYENHSQGIEMKLTELTEVLERSSQLNMELQGASQTLAAINKGLQQPPGQ